ncbi:hypothetical protein EUGRSUZ_B01341 [Eucalyptus grandis]|uniref:XPG-I domain-containing protein n=2 Tax=Eucalyptus grandis TaxID=71139 RepID=A0A059D280_EUCGR|nr:hypothetical protein EUGRSUZ_B01341 [Eucalyptus grandis]
MRFKSEIPQKDTDFSNVAWLAPDPISNGTALHISKKIGFLDKTRFPSSANAAVDGLTKLLADNAPKAMKEQKLESYFGWRIAVDASMSIYQFLVVVGRKGTQMLTNEAGEVTSHLRGMFYRTIRLLEAGIKPSQNKEDIEKFSKRTVKHNDDCKILIRLIGVPVVEAPSEAEAQCAALCKAGRQVYAVASEDMDSLTFGAPILEEMNLDMDQLIDLCIFSGCDYCSRGLTALKLIRQHGSIKNILENINKQRYQIPDNWPYSEAQLLLEEPIFSSEEQPEIKWTAPNGLISFVVNENGFNIDRAIEKIKAAKDESSQGRFISFILYGLESFFKPAKNLSVPARRKRSKCTLQSPNLAFKTKTFSTQVSVNPQPRFRGSFKMPTMVLGLRNFKQPLRVVCLPTWI